MEKNPIININNSEYSHLFEYNGKKAKIIAYENLRFNPIVFQRIKL